MRLRIQVLSLALAIGLTAGVASAADWGVQGFGGAAIPMEQDDNSATSTTFGVRFPISGTSVFSLEPYMYGISDKEFDETFGSSTVTRSGINVTTIGANVAIAHLIGGRSFKIYPFAGVNSNTLRRDEQEITKIGFNGGLGMGFRPGKALIDIRGDFNMVDTGDASRKWVNATIGLGFRLGPSF
jgi:hypothetical protein